eukprot:m.11436 g.11436  ORF g.11436 m.11436 type:complete len:370 (+) comp3836_c0_seq2:52-1161(+)
MPPPSSATTAFHNLSDGAVIIITGASSGIGLEAAKQIACLPCSPHLILACRSVEKANSAALEIKSHATLVNSKLSGVDVLPLDVTSSTSIRRFHEKLYDLIHERAVDALVLNAGIAKFHLKKPEVTEDGHEIHFSTNYLGHFYLTHLLLPALERSRSARVVFVSSGLHDHEQRHNPSREKREVKDPHKQPFLDVSDMQMLHSPERYTGKLAYSNSKLAGIMFCNELTRRLRETGVMNVSCVSLGPGFIPQTDLFRHSSCCVKMIVQVCFGYFLQPLISFTRTPQEGGLIVTKCVSENLPKPKWDPSTEDVDNNYGEGDGEAGNWGGYYRLSEDGLRAESFFSSRFSYNKGVMKSLYDYTCDILQIKGVV